MEKISNRQRILENLIQVVKKYAENKLRFR